jgi:plastocyanin
MMKSTAALLATVVGVNADVYMHNPSGSNNRLNEQNANRNNGNRLFDSQNNNRGGYNVGDKTDNAFNGNTNGAAATEPQTPTNTQNNQKISWVPGSLDKDQYAMQYLEGSKLQVQWTNQHGCGGNEKDNSNKLNCNMVLQFACNTDATQLQPALKVMLKDGRNTNAPDTSDSVLDAAQITTNDNNGRGRHESEAWYYECTERERDLNLFTADQNLKGEESIYTRQNPNGGRRGLECPEERDYYPYWAPTPFMDIAYLTSNPEDCTAGAGEFGSFNIQGESMNNNPVYRCSASGTTDADYTAAAKQNTKDDCEGLNNPNVAWEAYTHGLDAPVCRQGDWSRVNHLGNGVDAQTLSYNWTLPTVSKTNGKGVGKYAAIYNDETAKCILRIRYNISTDDYDIRNTDAKSNENNNMGVISPVTNNPTVDVKAALQGLRLAINTNQFGRTFQDRSHSFYIKKRSTVAGVGSGDTVQNLNVRGKRGNIVQTFPSTEYDFTPNRVHLDVNDVVHVQWKGSNTHDNGNPAGDGQAGDAGEGTGGTDRHNLVSLKDKDQNYPLALDKDVAKSTNIFSPSEANFECFASDGSAKTMIDCAVAFASSNFYETQSEAQAGAVGDLSQTLDNAYASLHGGLFLKPKKSGEYNYMCTRNNNFTNRSQKGVMIVG